MQYRHLAGISLTCLVLLLGCSQPDPRNLSIEGIWTGTPETALDYPESNLINAFY
jgi:hypothetical protein